MSTDAAVVRRGRRPLPLPTSPPPHPPPEYCNRILGYIYLYRRYDNRPPFMVMNVMNAMNENIQYVTVYAGFIFQI